MDDVNNLLKTLNSDEYIELMHNMYLASEDIINEKWQDEAKFIAYLKAYCIYLFLKSRDERQQGLFLLSLDLGFGFIGVFSDFIEKINATEAKMADLINSDVLEEFKELTRYINHPIYKELSKSNKIIAKLIKDFHCYNTIDEIKSGKYMTNGTNPIGYKLSGNEIEMIDRVKKISRLNTLAHMLYDERTVTNYRCDNNDKDDRLRYFLMNTSCRNPEFDIIYEDGTIINYNMGEIRVKPYTFQDIFEYTKLFYASHYEDMKKFFDVKDDSISVEIGKQMVKSSLVNVMGLFYTLEDVYTQKMIDTSKEELTKMKKLVKDYNL